MANVVTVNGKPIYLDGKEEGKTEKLPLLLPDNFKRIATSVIDTQYTEVSNEEKNEKEEILLIQTPVFILFAEFLGYNSLLIEMAENWCNPNKSMPSKNIQTLLEREARTIYDEMLELYSEEEIHELYKMFYTCGLDELENDLNEKRKKAGDDLPF